MTYHLYDGTPNEYSPTNLPLNEVEKKAVNGLHLLVEGLIVLHEQCELAQELELHKEEEKLSISQTDELHEDDDRMGKIRAKGMERESFAQIRLDRTLQVIKNCLVAVEQKDIGQGPGMDQDKFFAQQSLSVFVKNFTSDD
ncbi:MAG: hypothetical protein OXG88_07575 [Gammaproteobacteria bacterium]|nr:hypothetical protein [Gammaproteobacteria bacterium]